MKNSLLIKILVSSLALTSAREVFAEPLNPTAGSEAPTEFHIAQTPLRIPKTFFGVHDSRLFGVGRNKDHVEPGITELIKDIGFEILRGPDGTGSNYYLWREGRPLNSKDARYEKSYGPRPVGMLERINLQPGFPPLTLADIFKPAAELGLPYVFALNVSSQSVEEIAEQVREMRKLTKFPLRVELGNELYAVLNDIAFPKVSDYIAKSRMISEVLRKIDPTIQIGIVGVGADLEGRILGAAAHRATDPSVDMETTQKGRVMAWNKALRENADIYDAVTIHISPPINGPLDTFTADSLMQYLFAFNQSSAEKLLAQAASFPGKELWITEWGFLPMAMLEEDGPKRDRAQFLKTPGMAVARADRLLSMAQIPGVTVTAYHDLLGGNGFGIVQKDSKGGFVQLPTFHVFKALGALFRSSPMIYTLSCAQVPVENVPVRYTVDTIAMPLVSAYAFGNGQTATHAVFINRSASPRTARLRDASLKTDWIYGGGDPLPDFQNYPGKFTDPPRVNPPPQEPKTGDFVPEITLPPYSMTICSLKPQK